MKARLIITSLMIVLSQMSYSQIWGDSTVRLNNDIFYYAEKAPKFPGGVGALYDFIGKHLRTPSKESNDFSNKYVLMRIIINKEGRPVFGRIEKGINPQFNQAALAILDSMPNWTPALQNGKPVFFDQVIPIVFVDG